MINIFVSIITILFQIVQAFVKWTLPVEWTDALTEILVYVYSFEGLIPVVTVGEVVVTCIVVEFLILLIRIIFAMVNFARGVGKIGLEE